MTLALGFSVRVMASALYGQFFITCAVYCAICALSGRAMNEMSPGAACRDG